MPVPGCTILTTISPMSSATVVNTSKYASALMPTRPSFRMSPMPAMPTKTVKKMMGPIIIRMSLMNPSPRGFMATAAGGYNTPSNTPRTIPRITRKYSER